MATVVSPRLLLQEHFVRFAQLARDHQARGDSSFARRCRKVSTAEPYIGHTHTSPFLPFPELLLPESSAVPASVCEPRDHTHF